MQRFALVFWNDIIITLATEVDYNLLIVFVKQNKFQISIVFSTSKLPEDKPIHVVIRGIHQNMDVGYVKNDFHVVRMDRGRQVETTTRDNATVGYGYAAQQR